MKNLHFKNDKFDSEKFKCNYVWWYKYHKSYKDHNFGCDILCCNQYGTWKLTCACSKRWHRQCFETDAKQPIDAFLTSPTTLKYCLVCERKKFQWNIVFIGYLVLDAESNNAQNRSQHVILKVWKSIFLVSSIIRIFYLNLYKMQTFSEKLNLWRPKVFFVYVKSPLNIDLRNRKKLESKLRYVDRQLCVWKSKNWIFWGGQLPEYLIQISWKCKFSSGNVNEVA